MVKGESQQTRAVRKQTILLILTVFSEQFLGTPYMLRFNCRPNGTDEVKESSSTNFSVKTADMVSVQWKFYARQAFSPEGIEILGISTVGVCAMIGADWTTISITIIKFISFLTP